MPAIAISKCKQCRVELGIDEGWASQLCDACTLDNELEQDERDREREIDDHERELAESWADEQEHREARTI